MMSDVPIWARMLSLLAEEVIVLGHILQDCQILVDINRSVFMNDE